MNRTGLKSSAAVLSVAVGIAVLWNQEGPDVGFFSRGYSAARALTLHAAKPAVLALADRAGRPLVDSIKAQHCNVMRTEVVWARTWRRPLMLIRHFAEPDLGGSCARGSLFEFPG